MSIILHLKRFKTLLENCTKHVRVEFRKSPSYAVVRNRVGEYLLVNEIFIWNLETPLNPGEPLDVYLIERKLCNIEQKIGYIRLGLQTLTLDAPKEIVDPMLKEGTTTCCGVYVEMTVFCCPDRVEPGTDEQSASLSLDQITSVHLKKIVQQLMHDQQSSNLPALIIHRPIMRTHAAARKAFASRKALTVPQPSTSRQMSTARRHLPSHPLRPPPKPRRIPSHTPFSHTFPKTRASQTSSQSISRIITSPEPIKSRQPSPPALQKVLTSPVGSIDDVSTVARLPVTSETSELRGRQGLTSPKSRASSTEISPFRQKSPIPQEGVIPSLMTRRRLSMPQENTLKPSLYAFHQALLTKNKIEKESKQNRKTSSSLKSGTRSDQSSQSSALESDTDADETDPLINVERNIATLERSLLNKHKGVTIDIDSEVIIPSTRESKLKQVGERLFRRNLSFGDRPLSTTIDTTSQQEHKSNKMRNTFRSVRNLMRFGRSKVGSCDDAEMGLLDTASGGFSADEATTSQPPLSADEGAQMDVRFLPDTLKMTPKKIRNLLETGPVALKAADFQVCLTIIEVRQLTGLNMDPLVGVQVGDTKKYTSVKECTNCPVYNEYFVFDMHVAPTILMDKIITLSVYSRVMFGSNKLLGTFKLDVATVWNQPDRQFYHKWALLTDPKDIGSGPKGYLKCDICVIGKGDKIKVPTINDRDNDDVEANLLLPDGAPLERQLARYIISIHKADGLPKMSSSLLANVKKAFTGESGDHVDPYVVVSFAGMTGQTSVSKNCTWDEKISFFEMFPPLTRRIRIQIKDANHLNGHLIGTHYIDIREISNAGECGFLPTFGPAYVYVYGSTRDFPLLDQNSYLNGGMGEGISYRGRILLSVRTEIVEIPQLLRSTEVEVDDLPPIADATLHKNEDFFLFACIFEGTMVEKGLADKPLLFELSIGNTGNSIDGSGDAIEPNQYFTANKDDLEVDCGFWKSITWPLKATNTGHAHYVLPIWDGKLCLQVRSIWPDHRRRMVNSNIIANIFDMFEEGLAEVEYEMSRDHLDQCVVLLKSSLDVTSNACANYVRHMTDAPPLGCTKLDKERLKLCLHELGQLVVQTKNLMLMVAKHSLKKRLRTAHIYLERIRHLCEDPQHSMPDVFLWLVSNGKRLAYHRIPARKILYSDVPDETGKYCGKMQTIFLKTFQMRAYIYQARSLIGSDASGLSDPFARIVISDLCQTTQVIDQTLSPTWDETLVFDNIIIYSTLETIKADPPMVVIEFFDQDSVGKSEFIGRTIVKPSLVKSLEDIINMPPNLPALEWHDIRRGDDNAGELLATFELLEMPGTDTNMELPDLPRPRLSEANVPLDVSILNKGPVLPVPLGIRPTLSRYRIEVLFWGLRDLKRVHFLSVNKPRVDIECSGHILNSSVIQDAKVNPNFSNPTQFIEVELPEQNLYQPPLTIRVVDCRSFGRNILVGTVTINSIKKYIYTPLTKLERQLEDRKKSMIQLEDIDLHTDYHDQGEVFNITHERGNMPMLPDSRHMSKIGLDMRKYPSLDRRSRAERDRKNSGASASTYDEGTNKDWWTRYLASYDDMLEDAGSKGPRTSQAASTSAGTSPKMSLEGSGPPPKSGRECGGARRKVPKTSPKKGKRRLEVPSKAPTKKHEIPKSTYTKIYPHELEAVPVYNEFKDCLQSFALYRGKKTSDEDDEARVVGTFKGAIKIYKWPLPRDIDDSTIMGHDPNQGFFQGLPSNEPIHVLVRVYIVKATDLHPMDMNGKADPYIVLTLGNKKISDQANYISKQLNPVFGKCFEIDATFPQDSNLSVTVVDWDLLRQDEVIGETKIDLENRFYSRHRGTCGLPEKYDETGYNRWRDSLKPTQILAKLCKENKLEAPAYEHTRVKIGRTVFVMPFDEPGLFSNLDVMEEQMALVVLRRWHEMPRVGCHLMREHVETRALYKASKPGIEQGRIQMWVDIFAGDMPAPGPPLDISPRKPKSYELRVIIWNTEDVVLQDDAFFTGEKMSDIYVKGWLKGPKLDVQSTDVHYRSLTGEGNFNWRFLFPFDYLDAEELIVTSCKESLFAWDETEFRIPPRLELQVWDSDHFTPDDFLGALTLDLTRFPRGAKSPKKCTLDMMVDEEDVPMVNIFKQRRVRGWWPASIIRETGNNAQEMLLTGKVEAEIHLLSREEADAQPVGKGWAEPDALDKPIRPDTSFLWIVNTIRSFRYILWNNHKAAIVKWGLLCLVIFLFLLMIIAIPGYFVKKAMGA